MDPGTVLRKTEKGLEEMAARTYRLPQRSRSVLIVVDGKLSRAAVLQRTVDPAGAERLLDELIEQGFVAALEAAPEPPPAQRPAATSPGETMDLGALRRTGASAVIDALGPDGETIAMQIEKCKSSEQLSDALGRTRDIIRRVRGEKAALAFAQRCGIAAP